MVNVALIADTLAPADHNDKPAELECRGRSVSDHPNPVILAVADVEGAVGIHEDAERTGEAAVKRATVAREPFGARSCHVVNPTRRRIESDT